MNTVDKDKARKRAKEKADMGVALMFRKANTPEAHRAWSLIFWREYHAYVRPSPLKGR